MRKKFTLRILVGNNLKNSTVIATSHYVKNQRVIFTIPNPKGSEYYNIEIASYPSNITIVVRIEDVEEEEKRKEERERRKEEREKIKEEERRKEQVKSSPNKTTPNLTKLYCIEAEDGLCMQTILYIGQKKDCISLCNPHFIHKKLGKINAHVVEYDKNAKSLKHDIQ